MGPFLRWYVRTLLAVAMLAVAPRGHAESPFKKVEVSTKVARKGIDIPSVFRSEILQRIQGLRTNHPDMNELVLSASLLQLETRRDGHRAHSLCVVSAMLRKPNGALVAVLRGRARAEDGLHAIPDNELAALRAAVKTVMHRLPDAIK
ncbi:MAG TPA: hypothetical protein PLJ27_13920 [Polyangiaceae bacterium]|jgi:hypothetical protein|nr:MAG: hypothetical protein BWY17_03931 [Deltaproteobacteria bacterium ADurb.Bin207]HNS96403.1 hypothetical protein [Polyangiaceae bacterium]HNZ22872.1 hypothetical protein [Polyangiaceae bacterium]HOD21297.1 hypothetical protein [Polyangiaceae bacterium]HOE48456.1 hypothetical protein [Polyangiaceae bacterium]